MKLTEIKGIRYDHNTKSVGGSLNLEGTNITELPEGLNVGGPLELRGTNITELPEELNVSQLAESMAKDMVRKMAARLYVDGEEVDIEDWKINENGDMEVYYETRNIHRYI